MTAELRRRLDKLEGRTAPELTVVWKRHDETDDAAKGRWRREHPGRDPDAAGSRAMLVQWMAPA